MMMKESRVIEQQSRLSEPLASCYPWLVLPHCEDESRQTFCSISKPFKSIVKSTSKFGIKQVLGHSYGWLIISRKAIVKPAIRHEFISLWNPVSSESINLPPLDLNPDQEIFAASLLSPPGNPDSVVLVFDHIVESFIFCKIGDKNWTTIPANETGMEMEIIDDEPSHYNRFLDCCPVNYKGRCYVAMSGELKVIEQVNPNQIMLRSLNCNLPPLDLSTSACHQRYLVESRGQLCVIYITLGGLDFRQVLDIEIFGLDSLTMEWSQVKSSKDRAFFFSMNSYYAISCAANKSGIEGGFVYFSSGTDKILYFFNIEDRSISIRLPFKNFLPRTTPFWFKPDSRSVKKKTEVSQIIRREVKRGGEEKQIETSLKLKSRSFHPWLMFADKGNGRALHTFIAPNLGGRHMMNIPESIIDFDIRYSKEGWLLMSSKVEGDLMFFYNPSRKNLIPVPPRTLWDANHSFGFSRSPTSPAGCIIVGISMGLFSYLNLSRDEQWHQEWRDDDPYFTPTHTSPVYFNEAFYFLGQEGNLGVLWFEESNDELLYHWDILETPTNPCDSFDQSYLLECDGNIFAVSVDNLGEDIGVYKLNKTTMAWHKVRDIGKYMFFVSSSSSFSMVAKTPGMGNKIYFPKIKGKEIVYYCLRTGKYGSFGSKQEAANFYSTTEYLCSAWI
ncbi:hypothetical protein PTKIN_Ptkin11bG0181200 [Pterospermum kingtungense]